LGYGAYPLTFGWNKLDVPARDRAKSKQRFREETVVKVSVFYPNSAGCKFDMTPNPYNFVCVGS
jgi:hypothetical protein